MLTNLWSSYYNYRASRFAGFGGLGAWPDLADCAAKADDCPGCLACCSSTYPTSKGSVTNIRKKKRCIIRCQLKFGSACGGGGTGVTPTPAAQQCGIVCTSGSSSPTGETGQCHYDCTQPPSSIANPAPGQPANYPISLPSTNIVDTTTDGTLTTSTDTVSSGGGLLDFFVNNPLLSIGILAGGFYLWKKAA